MTDGDLSLERADALIMASWVAVFRNRSADAIRWTTEAIDILRDTDEELRLAYALARGGHWAFGQGDAEAGLALLSESLEICDRIAYEDGKAWPVVLIAQARLWIGDESDEVESMLLEARRRFSEMEEPFGQIHADMLIGRADKLPINERLRIGEEMVAVAQHIGGENTARPTAFHAIAYPTWDIGETDRAEGLNRICVRSALASGNEITLGMGLYQAAVFASRRENPERAARLFGAAVSHFGMDLPPFYEIFLRPDVDHARAAVGTEQFDEIHRIGAAMGIGEAAAYALG